MVVISSILLYNVQIFGGQNRFFLTKCKWSNHKFFSSISTAVFHLNNWLIIMLDQILDLINIGSNVLSAYLFDLFKGGQFHFDIDPGLAQ